MTTSTTITNNRKTLGELAVMAQQTQKMEAQIRARAQVLEQKIRRELDAAKANAMAGDDAEKAAYMDMVQELGRLQLVIARSRDCA